VREGSGDPIPD